MDAGLADVSHLLASIPVPSMPERLTQRVEAAIASEATQRAAQAGARSERGPWAFPGRPELPDRAPRLVRRPRMGQWSQPLLLRGLVAAGALVILVGGGILLASERPTGGYSSTAHPAIQPHKFAPSGAAAGSGVAIQLRYRHGAEFLYTDAVTSNANYTPADLASGIRRSVENSAAGSRPSATVSSGGTPAVNRTLVQGQRILDFNVGQLELCLSAVAAGSQVLLVEVAHYQGQPATIIVLRPVGGLFHVIVVGLACGTSGEDILTRLAVPMG